VHHIVCLIVWLIQPLAPFNPDPKPPEGSSWTAEQWSRGLHTPVLLEPAQIKEDDPEV
jgi:hypothetical protein